MRPLTIGDVAARSGIAAKTIRFYEGIGLVSRAKRSANGYRAYGDSDVHTLRFIQRARSLGFTVKDIAHLLALYRDRARQSAEVKRLANNHIARIDRKMAELAAMRATLRELVAKCHGDSRPECPILNDLGGTR